MSRNAKQIEAYRRRNPWVLVNLQNAQALSGRFPTRQLAEQAAQHRGGVVEVRGYQVFFSETPSL